MFTASRLTLARRRRGLSITALAKQSQISAKSLSEYENEHREPTTETLVRIAEALDFPIEFFERDPTYDIQPESVSFRARTKTTARQRDVALASAGIAVDLSRWIEEHFHTPAPDVPTLVRFSASTDQRDPETAADMVRARWGLGEKPLGNIIHLLEAHGVRVFSLTGHAAAVDAFAFRHTDRPIVMLNTDKTAERSRFDAAHELGHLVLHHEADSAGNRELEREADKFASAFLMPEADIRAHFGPNPTVKDILARKSRWRVAAMALTYRLHDLGLLTDWTYRDACVRLSRMGFKSGEPGGIERERSRLLAKILRGNEVTGPGGRNVARALGIAQPVFNDYTFGLAMTGILGGGDRASSPPPALRLVR